MESIGHQIKSVRPSLYAVAPLTYCICWGYAVANVLLGAGIFFLYETTVPLAVANIFSYQVWGIIFMSLGFSKAFGLLTNNWQLVKQLQFGGLMVKSIWAIALVIRCFSAPPTIVITVIWLFFAFIQAVTYIYFIPKGVGHK
jgi:hypothetical protein